jgi:hypothetical protein
MRVGVHINRAGGCQGTQKPSSVVNMVMTNNNTLNSGNIFFKYPGIVDQGQPLSGIEKKITPVRFQEYRPAMLGNGAHIAEYTVLTKYGCFNLHNNPPLNIIYLG